MYFRDWNRSLERSDKRNHVVDNDIIANLWCECMNQGLSDYINQDTIQQSIKKIKLLDKMG